MLLLLEELTILLWYLHVLRNWSCFFWFQTVWFFIYIWWKHLKALTRKLITWLTRIFSNAFYDNLILKIQNNVHTNDPLYSISERIFLVRFVVVQHCHLRCRNKPGIFSFHREMSKKLTIIRSCRAEYETSNNYAVSHGEQGE